MKKSVWWTGRIGKNRTRRRHVTLKAAQERIDRLARQDSSIAKGEWYIDGPPEPAATGPTVRAGKVLVDPKRCPTLHRSLSRGLERFRKGWEHVIELRRKGKGQRLVKKLLGIKPKHKMTEETKERLRKGKTPESEG